MNVQSFVSQCKSQANQLCIDCDVSTAILLVFVRRQRERLCVAGLLLLVCYGLLSLMHYNPYYNK